MNPGQNHHEPGDDQWQPVLLSDGIQPGKRKALLWALVLDSRSIPCCVDHTDSGWQLLVPAHHVETARNELSLYEEQNRSWPPMIPVARSLAENSLPTISVLILLATFHNLTLLGLSLPEGGIIDFTERGNGYAAAIMNGEWWRAVTALTLHADLTHLLSNLTIGGVFIALLCRELGSGLAWALVLCSGSLGNLLNAWLQSPAHRSVGASTAVFGTVGILAAISMVRHRHYLRRRWLIPLAAGLALLAILGTEGKQTDLGAHLCGFIFGTLAGLMAEYLAGSRRPTRLLNALLAIGCLTVVMVCWWLALTAAGG